MADYKQIRIRRDTWSNWSAANPVLEAGEPSVVIDPGGAHHGEHRTGDGTTAFLDLPLDDQKGIDAAFGKYTKPSTGIPKSDLAPEVRAAIERAVAAALTINGVAPDANGNIVVTAGRQTMTLQGTKYYAYGHSFGQQQTPVNAGATSLYPLRVRDDLDTDASLFVNQTVSGSRTADILTKVKATWQRGDYGLVTFMGNQNDVGNQVPEATFKANVKGFIEWVRGPGEFVPTIVVVLDTKCTAAGYARYSTPPTDADVDRFNQYLRDVVAQYPTDGSVVIADPATGWNTATMVGPDGQHPNDRGQAFIAQAIETALGGVSYREGQNYGVKAPTQFYDSFNRPNSTSLGSNLYAQGYTILGSSTFGTIANRAYRSDSGAVGEACAVYDSGKGDVDLSLTMSSITTKGSGPVWRAADLSNMWALDVFNTGVGNAKVYTKTAGSFTQVGSALTVEVKSGSVVRVVHTGGTLTIYVDGVSAFTATGQTAMASNTKHGFRITDLSSAGGRLDDLVIK